MVVKDLLQAVVVKELTSSSSEGATSSGSEGSYKQW